MTWDLELVTASFGDASFAVEKTSDPLMRRWAEHRYPYLDGADVEDMGREPRRTTLTAIFLGDDASTDLGKLMLEIDDGETKTFTHPLFGSWEAKGRATNIDANNAFRDGYKVDLEFIEDGTATTLPTVYSIESLETTIATEVSALEAALDAIDEVSDAWDAAVEAVEDAISAVNDLVAKAKSYAAAVENAVNKVRSTIKKAQRALNNVLSAPSKLYDVARALVRTASSCEKLAESVTSSTGKIAESAVTAATSSVLLAQALYGDGTRAAEIEATSTIRNPAMIPAGARLKVPSK